MKIYDKYLEATPDYLTVKLWAFLFGLIMIKSGVNSKTFRES
jgi:hypothetical protein